jgi:hypothetical protein
VVKVPFRLFLLLSALSGACLAQSPLPVTGNLSQILGTPSPYAGVSIQLQNCAQPVTIPGGSVLVNTTVLLQADASGNVNSTVWPVDKLDCNGTTGNAIYGVQYISSGVPTADPICYAPVSSLGVWNLATLSPVVCSSSPPNPQDGSYNNLTVNNLLTPGRIADWHDVNANCTAFRGQVNVRDCGAVADGAYLSGSCSQTFPTGCYLGTDNTTAIRKAITALGSAGGTIYFPSSGTNYWMIGAPNPYAGTDDCTLSAATGYYGILNLPSNVTLVGAGRWITTLMANPGTGHSHTCAMIQNASYGTMGVTIRGMRLDGNENTSTTKYDFLHPNNNSGAGTNTVMAFILNFGTGGNSPGYGPSLIMDDFVIAGFGGGGVDSPSQNASAFLQNNGWAEMTNGAIAFNEWSTYVIANPDSVYTNVYWSANGSWNNLEGLKIYDGGSTFTGNYFGGGTGGTAQVLLIGGNGNKFVNCVFDNVSGSQMRLIDDGSTGPGANVVANSIFAQPGNAGAAVPFISIEGHSAANIFSGLIFSNGPLGHGNYAVAESGSATGNNVIGATIDSSTPPTVSAFLLSSGSKAVGTIGGVDTTYNSAGYKVNGTALASTNLGDTANIARMNTANTFTGLQKMPGWGNTQTATLTALAAAGTSPTIVCAPGFICTPNYGVVNLTLGSATTTGDLFSVSWATALDHIPAGHYDVYDNTSAAIFGNVTPDNGTGSTTQCVVKAVTAITAAHSLQITYVCI